MDEIAQQDIESSAPGEFTSRQQLLMQIGGKLIAAREARREKIDQAMARLKLHKVHIQALESGNWDMLPDQIYAIGFLRQYAAYLELDLSKEIGLLSDAQYQLTKPLTFPDPPVSPSKKWAWVAGIGFVLLFIIFNIISNNSDHVEPITTATTDQEASINYGEQQPVAEPAEQAAATADDSPDTATRPNMPAHKVVVDLNESTDAPAQEVATAAPVDHEYKFEAATGAVWMQVYSANASGSAKGKLLKEVLLQEGQYATIRDSSASLWINCGNALALRIHVDGKTVADTGTLGNGKKILRDYRFSLNND
ncbi:MAG: hypothetical protein AUJ57_04770 [Zetaproteobacteria bacterium CG1_02_53_45]|nr:MAG: hypothetical protein AUJ57_04770 [Zetaproteobacteria bacterium CG1_02_53_45]